MIAIMWLPRVIALMLLLVAGRAVRAADLSAGAACKVVTDAAAAHHFAIEPTPPGRYYCRAEVDLSVPGFFIADLHYAAPAPPGWAGSDLVGWYAVRRSDGKLFEWDLSNNALGEPIAP